MIIIADTGAILAALDRAHPAHERARAVLHQAGLTVVPPTALTELDHMLRKMVKNTSGGRKPSEVRQLGAAASRSALQWILDQTARTRIVLPEIDEPLMRTALAVMTRYAGLAVDLTDAVGVALAARYKTDCVFTVDERDFRAIRPLTDHKSFRLFPADVA